ncbi:MAG: hypothetical protein RIS70_3374 [Planctomycetota bacterium]|jgi:hypothetical protein
MDLGVFREKIFGKYLRRTLAAWQTASVFGRFVLKLIAAAHFILFA